MKRPQSPTYTVQTPYKHIKTVHTTDCLPVSSNFDGTPRQECLSAATLHTTWERSWEGPCDDELSMPWPSLPQDTVMEDSPYCELRMPQPLKHRVHIDDIDEYLAQEESSDSEEEEQKLNGNCLWGSVLHGKDSDFVDRSMNGTCLPMERKAGEKKLRIPGFILQDSTDRALAGLELVLYQHPAWDALTEKSREKCTDSSISSVDIDSSKSHSAPNHCTLNMDIVLMDID
ncbi:hypothetical protein BDF14DRAFT_1821401 [Spinellus fusiger]|nr:hypothetical protein BDF14DRAFT_1821401 [Spinellus fusiger]